MYGCNYKERDVKLFSAFVIFVLVFTRFNIWFGLFTNFFLLLLCICLIFLKYDYIIPISVNIKKYLKAFLVYYLCIIPSIVFSVKPHSSFILFCLMLAQYGIFALIILYVRCRKYLEGMLAIFLVFSSLDCLLTLIQLVLGHAWDNRGYGFGGWLLTIADIMCMLLPIALVILMDARFNSKLLKKSALFATISIVVGLLCNKSRGAWLTELIVVPITIFRYLKQNIKYLIGFITVTLCILSYMFATPQYVQRMKSITNITTNRSNADRIWTWRSAELMIYDYPITGVGFGQFHEVYETKYKYDQESQNLPHTHNNFIQVAVESGVVGIIGFLVFVFYSMYLSLRGYKKDQNPYDLLIFIIFLAHICLFGQIDYTMWVAAGMQPTFLFLLAVLLCLKETDDNNIF